MPVLEDALRFVDSIIPRYRETSDEGIKKGELWSEVSNKDARKAVKNSGIAGTLVNKITKDTFNKWFVVKSDNQKLIDDANLLFSAKQGITVGRIEDGNIRLDLKTIFTAFDKVTKTEGYGLLVLGLGDGAELDQPVKNLTSLNYLSLVGPEDIRKIILDKDVESETFGEIIGAKVSLGTGKAKTIHASRFIFKAVNTYGNDWKGTGIVKPAYGYLTVLENIIWSNGQAFYRYASGFPHIKKKGAKEGALKKIREQWADVNAMTGWASGEDTEIDFVGAKATALNPEQYWDVAIKAVAIGFEIPTQIIEGVAAGAVTGSETNLKEYYSDISSKQDEWTPLVEKIIRIGQQTGQIAKGEFSIEWNLLFEMNAKEQAEIEKLKAETQKIQIDAGIRTAEDISEETERVIKGDSEAFFYDLRTNLRAEDVERLTNVYSKDIQKLFSLNEFMKIIKSSEVEGVLTDSYDDLQRELELLEKSKALEIKQMADKNIELIWLHGSEVAGTQLAVNIVSSEKAKQIIKILKQSNYVLINSLGNDVTKKVLFEVQQGLLLGESYSKMRKRILPIINTTKYNAERIARTETARAMSESLKYSYRFAGVKKVEWITAGDEMVCQICSGYDGRVFDINKVPSQPVHPNCRCTLVSHEVI